MPRQASNSEDFPIDFESPESLINILRQLKDFIGGNRVEGDVEKLVKLPIEQIYMRVMRHSYTAYFRPNDMSEAESPSLLPKFYTLEYLNTLRDIAIRRGMDTDNDMLTRVIVAFPKQ